MHFLKGGGSCFASRMLTWQQHKKIAVEVIVTQWRANQGDHG